MLTKKTPTDIDINFQVVKFFGEDDKFYLELPDTVSPDLIPFLKLINPLINGIVYIKSDLSCSCCGSPLKESTFESIYPNKLDNVKRTVYKCSNKDCAKKERTKLDKFITKGSNYTNKIKMLSSKLKFVDEISFRKMSELFESILGIRIPKSTIYDHEDSQIDEIIATAESEIDEEVSKQDIKASGTYNYDEQFMKVSKNTKAKLQVLDANTKYAYPTLIVDNDEFNSDTVLKYWKDNLGDLPRKTMVTDGHTMYPSICKEFKIDHALCTFHAIFNIRKKPYKKINRNNRTIKSKNEKIDKKEKLLEKLNEKYEPRVGRFKKTDTKRYNLFQKIKNTLKEISNYNKDIKKLENENEELKYYMDKISDLFKYKTVSTVINKFNQLKDKKEDLPDLIRESLPKIEKKLEKLIKHIESDDIPSTNNLSELFFRVTCPNKLKKYYRTDKGVNRKMKINRIRWNYRVCLGKKDQIMPIFVLQQEDKLLNL